MMRLGVEITTLATLIALYFGVAPATMSATIMVVGLVSGFAATFSAMSATTGRP